LGTDRQCPFESRVTSAIAVVTRVAAIDAVGLILCARSRVGRRRRRCCRARGAGRRTLVVVGAWVVVGGGTQTPLAHVYVEVGQSAGETQEQRRRWVASLGPQRFEQQFTCSRQVLPTPEQVRASPRLRPRRPSTPPARAPTRRRRDPDWASVLVSASNREPSMEVPSSRRGRRRVEVFPDCVSSMTYEIVTVNNFYRALMPRHVVSRWKDQAPRVCQSRDGRSRVRARWHRGGGRPWRLLPARANRPDQRTSDGCQLNGQDRPRGPTNTNAPTRGPRRSRGLTGRASVRRGSGARRCPARRPGTRRSR
jgi:hypothetical protein